MYRGLTEMTSFVLDPNRDPFTNTLWTFFTGAAALDGTAPAAKFDFHEAYAVARLDLKYCRGEFSVFFAELDGLSSIDFADETGALAVSITGADSGATADIVSTVGDTLIIENVVGAFIVGEEITDGTETATATGVGSSTAKALAADISFGFENPSYGDRGFIRVTADSTTGKLILSTSDRYGNDLDQTIDWQDSFNTESKLFIIEWFDTKPRVRLLHRDLNADNDIAVLATADQDNTPTVPLMPYVNAAEDGDSQLLVDYILIDNANQNSAILV